MPKILITGVSGFVGSAAHNYFTSIGWQVVGFAGLGRQSSEPTKLSSSICSRALDLKSQMTGVDVVLHCAGVAHGKRLMAVELYEDNVKVTRQVAEAAAFGGVRRFLFLSTISVYGDGLVDQVVDELSVLSPVSSYAASKRKAEVELETVCRQSSMRFTVIRSPLIYGPNAPGNFRRLVGIARAGIPLPLAGATAQRSYISIANLLSVFLLAAQHPDAEDEYFLVSDGRDLCTAELVTLIRQGMGLKPRLFFAPTSALRSIAWATGTISDFDRLFKPGQVSSMKLRRTLGWSPIEVPERAVPLAVSDASR